MNMKNIPTQLQSYKEKINVATLFGEDFKRLIGIELYDFINENKILAKEFNDRVNYLKNLSTDKKFIQLQKDIFETIQKILKITNSKYVQKKQKEWKNSLHNRLKTKIDSKDLTLNEMYEAFQNESNYYKLGDTSYFSPNEGEISIITHVVPIKKQYEMFEEFVSIAFSNDQKELPEFKNLEKEYNKHWHQLDELIFKKPITLHFQNFEELFIACVRFYERPGYETCAKFGKHEQITTLDFEKIKKNALIVVDDLLRVADEQSYTLTNEEDNVQFLIGLKEEKYTHSDTKLDYLVQCLCTYSRDEYKTIDQIVKWWEKQSGFPTINAKDKRQYITNSLGDLRNKGFKKLKNVLEQDSDGVLATYRISSSVPIKLKTR